MVSNPVTNYLRSNQVNETEKVGINRYRRSNPPRRGFLRTTSNYTAQNNMSPSANLFQVPTVTILTTRGARRLTETLIEQRIGFEAYNESPRRDHLLLRRSATQYRRLQPSIRRNVSLLQGNIGQSRPSGLFSTSPLIVTKLVQQGINQYLLMEKPTTGTTEFLSRSAELYQKVGSRSIRESHLFRQF